ncbi:MAG: MOSC N-terminal beta barrel domain-containing protein [Paracoccaceae bacterium]
MTGTVAQIWRHPIKSHGRESLDQVPLTAGRTMPWDRTWAVTHENTKSDGTAWAPCANFSIGSRAPLLQAIVASLDEATGTVSLTHPDRPDLRFNPDTEQGRFLEWVGPLMPQGRAASTGIVRVPDRGMTDTDFPSVSLINLASHRAFSQQLEQDLSPLRWRGNFLIDALEPWEEFDWIGKRLRIGRAELTVRECIGRCLATAANPQTGIRDVDTLKALRDGRGHTDFGVYGEVVVTGDIKVGDTLEVLS